MTYKTTATATILAGQSTSNAIQLNSLTAMGFRVSGSVLSGSQMGLLVSDDGITYNPLFTNDGTSSAEYLIPITSASRAYGLNIMALYPWSWMKFRLGASASEVNQATYPAILTVNIKSV